MLSRSQKPDETLELRHPVIGRHDGSPLFELRRVELDPDRKFHLVAQRLAVAHDFAPPFRRVVGLGAVDPRVEPPLHMPYKCELLLQLTRRQALNANGDVLHSEATGLLHIHIAPDVAQNSVVLIQGILVLEAPIHFSPSHAVDIDGIEDRQQDDRKAGLEVKHCPDVHLKGEVQPPYDAVRDQLGLALHYLLFLRIFNLGGDDLLPRFEARGELQLHLEAQGRALWRPIGLLVATLTI
mmetsp:Transcript_46207/g.100415  ORF Transcript_46207/g.100415 Transcript_46207/m.100415 type:complete len:239 (+) Transcript_46207:115-831(+)